MKPSLLSLLAMLSVVGCDPASGGSAPRVVVAEEPVPAPWSPPATKLPKAFVEETAFLLAHGLGDPRGREYGAATVQLGSPWGRNEKPVEIHGWVGEGRIVSLGGLVYDVVAPRGKASLESDVMNLEGTATPNVGKTWMPLAGADHETAVRLLLIAGRVKAAESLYAALPKERFPTRFPFLVRWFHQAVEAHMVGDDRTALRVGRSILRERPAHAERLKAQLDPRTHALPGGAIVESEPYPFLDVVPALVEDSERRLAAPHKGAFDPKTASVAELIENLDEVSARQWGQPGSVNLADDSIVAALGAKGAEAAEPLLDTMERDRRLTRSVSFGRDFFPARNLIPVRSAALAAFQLFAETDAFPFGGGAQLDVKGLRAYWEANKGKTAPDRWFDTLADDKAGWRRWEEAAQRLFDGQNVRRMGGWTTIPNGGGGRLKAEAVRGRANPSLSDLLERRARDVVDRNNEGLGGPLMYTTAITLGLDLAQWDPPRAVAVLQDLTRRSIEALGKGEMTEDYAGTFVVPALEARAKAGDATAWKDYLELLHAMQRFPAFDSKLLAPMVRYRDVPEVREATKLLTTPGTLYDVIGRLRTEPGTAGYDPIIVSPLLALPELQSAVLKGLDDKTIIGTSHVDERGNGWFEANGKPSPSQGVRPDPDDPKPPVGQKVPLRMADVVAHDLARLRGAPKFQPFWPVGQKDAAIEKMRAFLLAHRDDFETVVPWPNNWKSGLEESERMQREMKAKGRPSAPRS